MKRKGNPKLAPYTQTKSGGAVGDDSMRKADDWIQAGSGVDETVTNVGCEPNEKFLNRGKSPKLNPNHEVID